MTSIETIKNDIISEFSLFEDWMEKYQYIIELGKSIPLIDPKLKVEDNLIRGCQSKVWIHAELKNNNVYFYADSDAIITKGIIAILIRVFSNQEPKNILQSDTKFIDKIGLKEHLSPTRANGLVSMIKQIKIYALAFKNKIN
ncbi:MAG: Fe-S metabolism protein SufE [Flavobacteriaceae bacterium]|nr:Fe-S metabolism protein SufE [Flavobacteriaceae bacterium]|tara:strand:+ start:4348 stop:4773 length:426 start_codon:yes stop_codon:yes gene_type:complete